MSSHTFVFPTTRRKRAAGFLLLATLASVVIVSGQSEPTPTAGSQAGADTLENLQDELKSMRGQLPSQSHGMADVAYHFNNLWFAGQANNWPLAQFMLNEVKSHLRWAVRLRPVRPLSGGGLLNVGDMLTAVEQSTLRDLEESVKAKDQPRFVTAYKQQLASCYGCHVAAEKPYLRLRIPEHPAETMIEFSPDGRGSPEF